MANRSSTRLTAREGRKFGVTVGTAFLVLAGIAFWRHHPISWRVLGSLGGLFLAGGLILPTRMGPVQAAWMGMAHAISKVTTPIFMGLVYYLVMTPMGFLRRTIGRDPLRHPVRGEGHWVPRSTTRGDLERQF